MSRRFDGTNDQVRWSLGNVAGTGGWTFAAVLKFDTGVTWQGLVNLEDGATHRSGMERHGTGGDFATITGGGANTQQSGLSISSSDGWMLLAAARASGNNTVRFTKYPIGGSPSHATSGGNQDNQSPVADIVFGNVLGSDDFDGWLACVAIWDTNLNDADMESLASDLTRPNWLSKSPDMLVDELDAFATDYAGTSTRTTLDGTTDDADDPTGWAQWEGVAPALDADFAGYPKMPWRDAA
jgi:hypothetical protein